MAGNITAEQPKRTLPRRNGPLPGPKARLLLSIHSTGTMCYVQHSVYACGIHKDKGTLVGCLDQQRGGHRYCQQSIGRLPDIRSTQACPTCAKRPQMPPRPDWTVGESDIDEEDLAEEARARRRRNTADQGNKEPFEQTRYDLRSRKSKEQMKRARK